MSDAILTRCVEAETLDHLREDDPRAIRSRHDLRRINLIMGNTLILDSLLNGSLSHPPLRIAELGAGDGWLLLRLAKRRAHGWPGVTLTLVDRQDLLSAATRAAFADLGWMVHAAVIDVFAWLERSDHPRYDAIVANLFVHHFDADALSRLFRAIAPITDCFVACEPRRARVPLLASHLVGAVGANAVTRRDAVLSVRAGFRDRELSTCWPDQGEWHTSETDAWLFSHTFAAVRRAQA
ncbi:MAG TPA: class I SAM-dependent methyltransferase [Burkholderiales bacterium]|jgi:SAM-dependent methyltransferase|nr:class I SAM-dependent methyltransferase [Burkholderiales bacterium]